MSLQVWLPLTKDLRQQGLSTTTYTQNSGTAISSGGKLGSCLTATSNATVIVNLPTLATMLANGKTYSLACWVKITNNVTDGWVIKLGTNSCGLWWAASTARWVWNENDKGKRCANPTISGDANWHHLVTTVDKTVSGMITAKHYVDGVPAESYEMQTWDCSNHSQPAGTTITINPYVAQLNDIRLYDHCLSPMEVKELAKGLVLHYPLNRQGWGQNNLIITNSMAPTSGTNGWNSAGTGWANSNVTASGASNGHAIRCTYSGTTQVSGGIHHPTGVDKTTLTNGATYTLTARIRASKACIATFQNELMTTGNTINLTTDWKIYSYSCVIDNTKTYQSNVIYVRAADATQDMWIECDWIKLEEGTKATPWIPNLADPLYTTMGLNSTTEYDCSGFCNNGSKMTDTITYNSDTAKYAVSTHFNGTYDGIIIENLALKDMINSAITYAFWIKPESESGARSVYFGSYSGISWSVEKTAGNQLRLYWNSSPDETCSGAIITDGVWQHICITKSGTNDVKVYINGVQKWTSTATHSSLNFPTTYRIGRDTRSNDGTPYKGLMSDFRIYATALSADDVKSLYQNSAYIDSSGNVYGAVHSEA